MITSQRIAKALTLIAAALLLNVMACNKASFEATDPTNRPAFPDANGVSENGNQDGDDGDAINCGNPNSIFCNNNDDGFQDTVPPMIDPPFCDIKRPTYDNCYENIYRNSTRAGIAGINMWLVVDSSRSFDAARMAVARQVSQAFLTSLRHQVPVRVSVIPAHAPSSDYAGPSTNYATAQSFNGRVYAEVTIHPGSDYTSSMNQLLAYVSSAMQESPISLAKRDRSALDNLNYANGVSGTILGGPNSGSDEMGLHSFIEAMDNISIPANNGWVVVFLADENDICVRDSQTDSVIHPNEEELFDKGYCDGVTVANAINRAKAYAGSRPYAIGAMTYISSATIPFSAHGQSSVGRGYTDMAGAADSQGVLMDLARGSTQGLDAIARSLVEGLADVTNNSVGFYTHYPLYYPNGDRVNLRDVTVTNGKLDVKVYAGPNEQVIGFNSSVKEAYRVDYDYSPSDSLIMPRDKQTVMRFEFCVQ